MKSFALCVRACVRACMRACVPACVRVSVFVCVYVRAGVFVCMCACVCMCVCLFVCVRARVYLSDYPTSVIRNILYISSCCSNKSGNTAFLFSTVLSPFA